MILLFYICEKADTKANSRRMQVTLSPDQKEGEGGKGISSEEKPSARLTEEITEVCYQQLSKLTGAERILRC